MLQPSDVLTALGVGWTITARPSPSPQLADLLPATAALSRARRPRSCRSASPLCCACWAWGAGPDLGLPGLHGWPSRDLFPAAICICMTAIRSRRTSVRARSPYRVALRGLLGPWRGSSAGAAPPRCPFHAKMGGHYRGESRRHAARLVLDRVVAAPPRPPCGVCAPGRANVRGHRTRYRTRGTATKICGFHSCSHTVQACNSDSASSAVASTRRRSGVGRDAHSVEPVTRRHNSPRSIAGVCCKGEFASGRSSELVDDKLFTKAFTGCQESTGAHTYRYFILQRPGSGLIGV